MNDRRFPSPLLLSAALLCAAVGCQSMPDMPTLSDLPKPPTPGEVLHNLQPHRLAHLNRSRAPSRNTFFSVPDDVPTRDAPDRRPE